MTRTPRTIPLRAVGAAVAVLLALATPAAGAAPAAPAAAQAQGRVELRAKASSEARAALGRVRDALTPRERGIDDLGGRRALSSRTDVTHLLMELHAARGALRGEERREADAFFYRPTDGPQDDSGFTYEVPEAEPVDTTHFRIHYVTSGAQASDPAYVSEVAEVFEEVYANEVDTQGWLPPAPDGALGGNGLIDVYLSELGEAGAYGFAAPDNDNSCTPDACDVAHGFMVMDNDYDGYPPEPAGALRATTAHEFNHLSHFATSFTAEPWFYEATAVWQESVNYPDVDARTFYIDSMAALPELPITDFTDGAGFDRSYGLYVWSLWLAEAFGGEVIIEAWDQAAAANGHSLDGYDTALRARGSSFSEQFVAFAAATAAWDHGDFPQDPLGTVYPDVRRDDPLASGEARSLALDHTAYSLIPLPAVDGTEVSVTAPPGVAAGAAIVVDRGPGAVTIVEADLSSGSATLTVSATEGAEVTLAVVNADLGLAAPKDDTDGRAPLSYVADGAGFGVGVNTAAPEPGPGPGPDPGPGPGPAPGLPPDGERLDGGGRTDPIGQAIATSQALFGDGAADRVVLATADRFPDALAGAALTGARGPILYTSGLGALDPRTQAEIARVTGGDGEVLILGGTQAVSDQAAAQAVAAGGGVPCGGTTPEDCRYDGAARDETAALAAQTIWDENPLAPDLAFVARSNDFADAITGGALATALGAPILLTFPDDPSSFAADFLARNAVGQLVVLGGEAAVQASTAEAFASPGLARIEGPERTATAAAIARVWGDVFGIGDGGAVLVNVRDANGWQTALSAAVASALLDAPQVGVETPPTALGDHGRAYLTEVVTGPVVAFGDASMVSDQQLADAVAARG